MMGLMSLPSELLMAILIDLDFRNLLRCREICTRLKALIDEDIRAQYKFELAIAGMEDSPSSSLATIQRLSTLRAREAAWSKLAWTTKEDVAMRGGNVWKLYGNVLAQSEGESSLHFKQIPSTIRGIESMEWVVPDVGCNITEIGMDPAQDLLIVIEHFEDDSHLTRHINVHLKSLSTGAPHPAGPPTAMLTHNVEMAGPYSYVIRTSESYLGVLMSDDAYETFSELVVWDWKSGTLYLHLADVYFHSWEFLTPHSILVAHEAHLVIIDIESPLSSDPASMSEVDFVCAFRYPPLEDGIDVFSMFIRSDPGPNWRPNPTLNIPFSVSREDRLFIITFWLSDSGYTDITVLSVVPASTLLHALATLAPGETRREFRWAEWGPCGSRFIGEPNMYTSTETCYVYGTTFVSANEDTEVETARPVTLNDFNQLAVRYRTAGAVEEQDSEQGVRIVTEAAVFEPAGVFKETVTTSLPYIQRTFVPLFPTEEDREYNAVMLAEDALLLVSSERLRYCILSF